MAALHIGLIVNPLAGLGGALGLKGSDGEAMLQRLPQLSEDQRHRSADRVVRALKPLVAVADSICFSTWGGDMGALLLEDMGFECHVLGAAHTVISNAEDTRTAAAKLRDDGVDVIVFAGGDGTARDIYDAVGDAFPVLGIPAGVKMHSGVFAVSPEAAGELLQQLVSGGLVGLRLQEVRDIDEAAFRQDQVRSRFYGEMQVPGEGRFLQHTKVGGRECQELVAAEIAAWFVEQMDASRCYLVGPGSTTGAIMEELGLPNTLLGVDVVHDGQLVASDADEATLLGLLTGSAMKAEIVVTVIGGQGHLFGRGNQQFSPAVIRAVGVDSITIVAAKSKITGLEGRPLLVDTNDPVLDTQLSGYRSIITGYDDQILYRVANEE